MSLTATPPADFRTPGLQVRPGQVYKPGDHVPPHSHDQHMISWSATATMTLQTENRNWLLPPTHALWLPAGTVHSAEIIRPGRTTIVLIDVERCPIEWTEPTGIFISPLTRELLLYLEQNPACGPKRLRCEALLFDMIEAVPSTAIQVPLPTDDRIRPIADALIADPADDRDLAMWAATVGAGLRTVARLFNAETGMTFAQWRTQVRVRAAVAMLARGLPVGVTARAVGYRNASAFSATFRQLTGKAPGEYHNAIQVSDV